MLSHVPEIKPYKYIFGRALKAHIFFPTLPISSELHPVFAFFHGGGWVEGQAEWGYPWCLHFSQLGFFAISFEYRLSVPKILSPAVAMRDATSAIRWIRRVSSELAMDPNRIAGCGYSAGGHLVASTAFLKEFDESGEDLEIPSSPDALILLSTPVNIMVDPWFNQLLDTGIDLHRYSPAHHIRHGLPPVIMFHAVADQVVPYTSVESFCMQMRACGNKCELHAYKQTDHFFGGVGSDLRSDILLKMESFLSELGFILH